MQAVPPSNIGKSFRRVRRGYEPEQVDAFLREIEEAMRTLEQRAKVATARAGALERQIAGAKQASTGVGRALVEAAERKQIILEEAQERAASIVAEAEARVAWTEGGALRSIEGVGSGPPDRSDDPRLEAERILSVARTAAAQQRDQAWVEVEQTLGSARAEAERILLAARRDALELLTETRREAQELIARTQVDQLDRTAVVARLPVRRSESVGAFHDDTKPLVGLLDDVAESGPHHIVVLD